MHGDSFWRIYKFAENMNSLNFSKELAPIQHAQHTLTRFLGVRVAYTCLWEFFSHIRIGLSQ